MLRDAWFLARKDVYYMLRQRETLLWVFLMPILFFFFIGSATGGFGSRSRASLTPLVVDIDHRAGFMADHTVERLGLAGFRVMLGDTLSSATNAARLEIPEGYTDHVLAGEKVNLRFTRGSGGLGAEYDQVRLWRTIIGVLGDLLVGFESGEQPTRESLSRAAALPRTLLLEVQQAGHRKIIPTGFSQAIPGTMVMFTLMIMLTSGATLLVIERKQGLLRRLASSPLSRTTVMLGKWWGRMILGAIQMGFAMLVGTLIFKMDWGSNLPTLIGVLLVYAGLVAMIGILLGNLARSEGQAVGIGVVAANVFGALGGCWWPIEITPEWMQKLSLAFPTGWAMDAMHKLVNFGDGPSAIVTHVLVLGVAAVAAGWLAARTFRYVD